MSKFNRKYDGGYEYEIVNAYVDLAKTIAKKYRHYDFQFFISSLLYFDEKGYLDAWINQSSFDKKSSQSQSYYYDLFSWIKENTNDELAIALSDFGFKLEFWDNNQFLLIVNKIYDAVPERKKGTYELIIEALFAIPYAKNYDFYTTSIIELNDVITSYITPTTSIYNPFAGPASILCNIDNIYDDKGIKMSDDEEEEEYDENELDEVDKVDYKCDTLNKRAYLLGKINLYFSERKANFTLSDSLETLNDQNNTFDTIVSIPPLDLSIDDQVRFLELCLDRLSNTGKLITVLPARILFHKNKSAYRLRKKLVDNDWFEKVFILPKRLFDPVTGVETCLIILNKDKQDIEDDAYYRGIRLKTNVIQLVDARSYFIKKENKYKLDTSLFFIEFRSLSETIDRKHVYVLFQSDVISKNYDLHYRNYVNIDLMDFEIPDNYVSVKLKEILKPAIGVKTTIRTGRIFTNSYFSDYASSFQIDSKDVAVQDFKEEGEYNKYTNDVLIISPKHKSFQGVYVTASKEYPIYVPESFSWVLIIKLKDINPSFLIHSFKNEYFKYQLKQSIHGRYIFIVDFNAFLDFNFFKPKSLSIQDKIIETIVNTEESTRELNEAIKLELDSYKENLRTRKHNIAQLFPSLFTTTESIKRGLEKDETKDLVKKLDYLIANLVKASNSISALLDENIFGEPEWVDLGYEIATYVRNYPISKGRIEVWNESGAGFNNPIYIKELKERGYTFWLYLSEGSGFDSLEDEILSCSYDYETYINKDNLFGCLDNIIQNAVQHAFIEDRDDYRIVFSFTRSSDDRMVVVNIYNNGKPAPDNLTEELFFAKGGKIGRNANQGLGGAYIKEMMEHFGGYATIDTDGGVMEDFSVKDFDWQGIHEFKETPKFHYSFKVSLYFVNTF